MGAYRRSREVLSQQTPLEAVVLNLISVEVFEEVLTCIPINVLESKYFLTTKPWTLHYAVILEDIRRDNRSTDWTGMSNDTHF